MVCSRRRWIFSRIGLIPAWMVYSNGCEASFISAPELSSLSGKLSVIPLFHCHLYGLLLQCIHSRIREYIFRIRWCCLMLWDTLSGRVELGFTFFFPLTLYPSLLLSFHHAAAVAS